MNELNQRLQQHLENTLPGVPALRLQLHDVQTQLQAAEAEVLRLTDTNATLAALVVSLRLIAAERDALIDAQILVNPCAEIPLHRYAIRHTGYTKTLNESP